MPDLMIKLTASWARRIAQSGHHPPAELAKVLETFKATLGPPTGTVGEASQYFRVDAADPGHLVALQRSLERLDGVEAAYVKPADEAP
jgi:hypothetical protein